MLEREGAVEVDLDEAHLFAAGAEIIHDLADRVAHGAHRDDDALGVGRAEVVEEPVFPARQGGDLLHIIRDDVGEGGIGRVDGFAVLEEGVVVLAGVADARVFRVQRVIPELLELCIIDELCHVVEVEHLDLLDLMGGTEAVEEVLHGDVALDGREMRHRAEIHALLHAGGGELCPAGLAAGHDVGVIAENRDGVRADGACCHVHHAGQLQPRDAVHRRDHQHQTLRRGIGRGERAGLQHALQRAAGARFGLHLHDADLCAEDVFQTVGGPLVHVRGHRTRRGDGIDGCGLGEGVGDVRGGLVAVHGFEYLVL